MSKSKEKRATRSELKIEGSLVEKGVKTSKEQSVNEFSSRGYGVTENDGILFTFYEALHLLDKGMLEIKNEKGEKVDFQKLLQLYEALMKTLGPSI